LAGVAAGDLAIIASAAQISESAETAAGGFNDAIAAAGGTGTTAGTALQNGKIKNKVLKLQTDVLRLLIEQAQGKTGLDAQIATQQTKLATNVALDKAANGQSSTAIDFAGSD
jgi:1-aminocyclopropane-1-carboxylate deaminase/D-cysteine desulfhydrase-like pyridoxal-dependent ACC family enzyme